MKRIIMSLAVVCLCLLALPATKADAAAAKLNKTTVSMYENKKTTLKVVNTEKKATWKTSNKKIATVKNGVVTGKKKGSVKITAKVSGKTYTCKVTVKKAAISASKMTLTVGESKKVSLNGAYKKVTYKTSNSKVATVKNGKIKAVGTGKVTITLTHNGKKYTCKVTVKAEKIITIKIDKDVFYDKDINKELVKVLKIKSKKVSGKYVVCKVTKSSYDKLLNVAKSEIAKITKTCVKKSPMIKKITYGKDYKTMNLYIKTSSSDDTKTWIDQDSLVEIITDILVYQCLDGTLLSDFDIKVNYYDASTNYLIYSVSIKDFL